MDIHKENAQVLHLVQAMLGGITPNFRAVFLKCNPDGVDLNFLLQHESEEDREEIEDIVFEFEALQLSGIDVEVIVSVDTRPLDELRLSGRMIYARRE